MKTDCVRNERDRVALRRGWKCRECEKARQPSQKATMETSAFSQRTGWLEGRRDAPRARKMVFPVSEQKDDGQ